MRLPLRHPEPDALRVLEAHEWPGNARQLRNVLERVLLFSDDDTIRPSNLPTEFHGDMDGLPVAAAGGVALPPEGIELDSVEREFIRQALDRTGVNKSRAARLLGLSRDTLRYRLERYGLEGPVGKREAGEGAEK